MWSAICLIKKHHVKTNLTIYLYVVPFDVVHVVLVHSELGPCQRHAGHLVLQGVQGEGPGDDVVQQKLQKHTQLITCFK